MKRFFRSFMKIILINWEIKNVFYNQAVIREFILIKYDFKNDKLYYQKIIEIKKPIIKSNSSAKLKKTFDNKNN